MWFKQIQLFELTKSFQFSLDDIVAKLEQLAFSACLPSMPQSMGWVGLTEQEDAPLVRYVNGCLLMCLQIEEKVMPAAVVRKEIQGVLKQMETSENRKLRQKEKQALKEEIILSLLPRAFSKLIRVYAYLDTNTKRLILGTTNAKLTDQFLTMFKKTVTDEIFSIGIKQVSAKLTTWVMQQNYPSLFAIEKACLLQDPKQVQRTIRCNQQNVFAPGVHALIKDGCEIIQLALSWQDRLKFVLASDFSIRSIQYQDEVLAQSKELEPETKQQQLDADFVIMTATLSGLLADLFTTFAEKTDQPATQTVAA